MKIYNLKGGPVFGGLTQSNMDSERYYTSITDNIEERLTKHNAGEVKHTSKYRPWRIKTYVAFTDVKRAFEFEKYLKSGSGRAFVSKHL